MTKLGTSHTPVEIRLKQEEKILEIDYDDGQKFAFPAEFLRVESPSAEVRGHGGPRKWIAGRRHVGMIGVEPVGNYAIRIRFDDLHDSGLYNWDFLYDLGVGQAEIWQTYLDALDAEGLSRDP